MPDIWEEISKCYFDHSASPNGRVKIEVQPSLSIFPRSQLEGLEISETALQSKTYAKIPRKLRIPLHFILKFVKMKYILGSHFSKEKQLFFILKHQPKTE